MENKPAAPASNPFFMTPKHYGFSVPVYQCLFTSLAWGGAVGATILLAAWFDVPIPNPFKVAITAGVLVFFVTILITWPRYMERWMWIIENITNIDLNQDGVIGKDDAPAPTLKVTVDQDGSGTHVDYDEIPYPERLPELARAVSSGVDFTFANWGGRGKLFSQPEWARLTEALRKQEYIVYKNSQAPNLGYVFTRKGQGFLRDLVGKGMEMRPGGERPKTHLSAFAVETTTPLPWWRKRV